MKNLICSFLGHTWMYADGFSTGRPMRQCRRCPTQEFLDEDDLNGNDIWESLFGIMKGNVPEELTPEVLDKLALELKAGFFIEPKPEINWSKRRA